MSEIQKLDALEILDSRGNPTIAVTVTLNNGVKATAKIPSGASTGTREAVELRDGDARRYGGKGVLKACAHVEGAILSAVHGMDQAHRPFWTRHSARSTEQQISHAWGPTQFLVCPWPWRARRPKIVVFLSMYSLEPKPTTFCLRQC